MIIMTTTMPTIVVVLVPSSGASVGAAVVTAGVGVGDSSVT